MSDLPVRTPIVTDALVRAIHLANEEAGIKEKAFDTPFRFSDAAGCARKLAYDALGYEQTDPPDLAGEWVMWLGTLVHEKVQDAIRTRFGSRCEVEVSLRHGSLTSGHIDAVIDKVKGIGRIAYELKTKGGYGFDKAIGINRKGYKETMPEGPGAAALIQGALNATAVDADLLVVGIIGMEAISRQLAARLGWDDLSRIMAEWHYDKATFAPWATAELARLKDIKDTLENGLLPTTSAIGDEFQVVTLNPTVERPDWRCSYCRFFTQCCNDGQGWIEFA